MTEANNFFDNMMLLGVIVLLTIAYEAGAAIWISSRKK